MATTNAASDLLGHTDQTSLLLISLPSMPHDALERMTAALGEAFPERAVLAATPDAEAQQPQSLGGSLSLVGQPPVAGARGWTLSPSDYLNAAELARQYNAQSALLLGPEAQSLEPAALRQLAASLGGGAVDLVVPAYELPVRSGLVNSAILYPLTRSLFGVPVRFPLALDFGLSRRMLDRLVGPAQRALSSAQDNGLVWSVSEAAIAGYTVTQAGEIVRTLPSPANTDLNTLLGQVTGSLFADIESKASYWQRAHAVVPGKATDAPFEAATPDEIAPLVETFRLAYGNLHEIWSLVLPPQSLLGLKRLSSMSSDSFSMPAALWARIVYDFLLAHRLRTINRGHLLGALTPLYLAWVASHLRASIEGKSPQRHIEETAMAFEADKAYLVSRWRWPDRFNP